MVFDYAHPTKDCDLVMKGGVTSGLVYPRAALQLAEQYRFKCIGGTSAGAVAAALTAAAEYDRVGGGFERLDEMNRDLQKEGKLRSLFQPSGATRPALTLFEKMTAYKDEAGALAHRGLFGKVLGAVRLVLKLLREIGVRGLAAGQAKGALVGILVAAAFAIMALLVAWALRAHAPLETFAAAALVCGTFFGVVGWILGGLARGLYELYDILIAKLPANFFGICNGLKAEDAPDGPEAVTEWMHREIQRIAGKPADKPLTIGELRSRGIELKTVTTNLSLGRPFVLPLPDPENLPGEGAGANAGRFIFRRRDVEALFPPEVARHLEDTAYPPGSWQLPDGFRFLPAERDLPAVVAARMSMSFPLFFSSVPLYQLPRRLVEANTKGGVVKKQDLIPNWFSDGGIASNFPIHFFDAWIPSRPTFGITLRYLPDEVAAGEGSASPAARHYYDALGGERATKAQAFIAQNTHAREASQAIDDVWLPRPGEEAVAPEWTPLREPASEAKAKLDDVLAFLWSVFGAAQNYRDNMQSELPSYSERIVQVRLKPNEGGFNLSMPTETIAHVVGKGDEAGKKLRNEFDFDRHQWIRFRLLSEQLDDAFSRLLEKERGHEVNLLALHHRQVTAREPYPWPLLATACTESEQRVVLFRDFMQAWINHKLFDLGLGDPLARLRITPRI